MRGNCDPKCKTHLWNLLGSPILIQIPSPHILQVLCDAKIFPFRNCATDWVLEKFFAQEFDQNSPLPKKFHLGIGPKISPLQVGLKILEYENR